MKLYRARVAPIARAIVERLCTENDIDVAAENREEAERDIVAILETYMRDDQKLQDDARELLERRGLSYDQLGKMRRELADTRGHPTNNEIEKYLSRQIVENFMISHFVEEVFSDDRDIQKKVLDVIRSLDVDENKLRLEARERIKNVKEGSVEFEEAMNRAMREVRKRHGLV